MKSCLAVSTAFLLTCLICTSGCGGGAGRTHSIEVHFEEVSRIGGASLEETDSDSLFGFGQIRAMDTDAEGNLYVLDASFMQVRKFSPDGEEVLTVQLRSGEGPGEVQRLSGLAVNDQGRIYILSRTARTVSVFVEDGLFRNAFNVRFMPAQIGAVKDRVYITSVWFNPDSILHQYDDFGNKIRSLLPRPENWQTVVASGNFGRFAFRDSHRLLYSYPLPYRIVEIDSLGEQRAESSGHPALERDVETTPLGDGKTITEMPSRSHGLSVLPGGYVINAVSEEEDEFLDIFSSNLKFMQRIPVQDLGLEGIRLMTSDSKGNVYFDTTADYPVIVKFTVSISITE